MAGRCGSHGIQGGVRPPRRVGGAAGERTRRRPRLAAAQSERAQRALERGGARRGVRTAERAKLARLEETSGLRAQRARLEETSGLRAQRARTDCRCREKPLLYCEGLISKLYFRSMSFVTNDEAGHQPAPEPGSPELPLRLTDPRKLRALAHPARIAILQHLALDGPATH